MILRKVTDEDLPIFFEHQRDAVALRMNPTLTALTGFVSWSLFLLVLMEPRYGPRNGRIGSNFCCTSRTPQGTTLQGVTGLRPVGSDNKDGPEGGQGNLGRPFVALAGIGHIARDSIVRLTGHSSEFLSSISH